MQETQVQSLSWEDPLEEGTATYFSILAWRIPRIEESGRLQSIGSHRVGHDCSNLEHIKKNEIMPFTATWMRPRDHLSK